MLSDVSSGEVDPKQIERKVYLSYYQDGLLDILIGIFIVGFGISMLDLGFGMSSIPAVLWSLSTIFFWRTRKTIAYTRMGYVSFSPERKAMEKKKLGILVALWCAPVMMNLIITKGFPMSGCAIWLREHYTICGQVFAVAFVSVVAILFGFRHLCVYAVLTLLVFAANYLLNIPTYLYFISLGTAIIFYGMIMMIRFLHRYPKVAEEVPHGEG